MKEALLDLKGSANVTTHGLKAHGDGNMYDGLVKYVTEAFDKGRRHGMSEGKTIGMTQGMAVGTVTVLLIAGTIKVIKNHYNIHKDVKEIEPEFLKELPKEQVLQYTVDKNFPWEDVKNKIKEKEYITETSFDMWIKQLSCRAYDDRVLVEVNDEKVDCDYISRKYKRIIQECIYEVTGKIYIVSIVRPGEILIEDMD